MTNEEQIRKLIDRWAIATREGRKDDVLASHSEDALIFDTLPPLKYDTAAEYRQSLDKWWPDTAEGEGLFDLQGLKIIAGQDVAFAHAIVRCGGTTPDGHSFEDTVRLTHCLQKSNDQWLITHSHTSMPISIPQ